MAITKQMAEACIALHSSQVILTLRAWFMLALQSNRRFDLVQRGRNSENDSGLLCTAHIQGYS